MDAGKRYNTFNLLIQYSYFFIWNQANEIIALKLVGSDQAAEIRDLQNQVANLKTTNQKITNRYIKSCDMNIKSELKLDSLTRVNRVAVDEKVQMRSISVVNSDSFHLCITFTLNLIYIHFNNYRKMTRCFRTTKNENFACFR